jgi:hypothetical protein
LGVGRGHSKHTLHSDRRDAMAFSDLVKAPAMFSVSLDGDLIQFQ